MRALFALWLMIILCSSTVAQDYGDIPKAVVRVWAGNQGGTGTMVLVDGGYGYVLTARHVVDPYTTAKCEWDEGYVEGEVIARGQSYDTAIIRLPWRYPANQTFVVPLAEEPPAPGERVDVFGFGGQSGPTSNQRLIHWSSETESACASGYCSPTEEKLVLAAMCKSGDSGGPVIHRGRVVGIITGGPVNGNSMVRSWGPNCRPIRNLFRGILPHAFVERIDERRAERGLPLNPSGRTPVQKTPGPPTMIQPPNVNPGLPVPEPSKETPQQKDDAIQKGMDAIQKTLADMRAADDERDKARSKALLDIATLLQTNAGSVDKQVSSLVGVTAELGKRLEASVTVSTQTAQQQTAALERTSETITKTVSESTANQTSKIEQLAGALPAGGQVPWGQIATLALAGGIPAGGLAAIGAWLASRRQSVPGVALGPFPGGNGRTAGYWSGGSTARR